MKKISIIITLSLLSFFGKSQGIQYQGTTTNTIVNRGGFITDSVSVLPLRDTTFPSWFPISLRKTGAIVVKSTIPYYYNGASWVVLSTGVPIDTTSLSNRINLKLNISDTASMLSPYLRKVDTASLSNRINERVKYSDSVTIFVTPTMLNDTASAIRADIPTIPHIYYQTVKGSNTLFLQRDTLHFGSTLLVTDDAPNSETDISVVSAPKLTTARNIQGVSFDGTANIDIINGTGLVRATGTSISYDNTAYGTGTVTSIATGLGLSGGTITTSGTLLVDTSSTSILSRQRAVNTYLAKADTTTLSDRINLKANIASPTFTGTVTIPTPFTLGATSVTSTGTQLNYLNSATGTTGTTSTNLVFSTSPTLTTPILGVAKATSLNTGTTLNGKGFFFSTDAVSLTSTTHPATFGDEASGINMAIGNYSTSSVAIQGRNNGVATGMFVQPDGGTFVLGNGSTTGQRLFAINNSGTGSGDWASWEVRNGADATTALRGYTLGTSFATSGSNFQDGAALTTGTGLSGGLSVGTQASADLRFYTNNTLRTTWAGATGNITTTGQVVSSGGGLGYTTGAGGTVSQGTSRTTTVVLNKLCGTITMFSSAQASDAVVTFTLTNSFIASTDQLIVTHNSATDGGAWCFSTVCGAGSATISVRNTSGSSITSATPLKFTVIKQTTN